MIRKILVVGAAFAALAACSPKAEEPAPAPEAPAAPAPAAEAPAAPADASTTTTTTADGKMTTTTTPAAPAK